MWAICSLQWTLKWMNKCVDQKKQPRSQKRRAWVWNKVLNKHELVSMLQDMSAIRWPMSASCPIIFQMSISNMVNHPSKCQNKSSSPFLHSFSFLPSSLLSTLSFVLTFLSFFICSFTFSFHYSILPSFPFLFCHLFSIHCSFLFHLYLCNLPLYFPIWHSWSDL